MKHYKLILVSLVVLASCQVACAERPAADGFVPLFNGQNLDGWVRVNTPTSTWRVADGMLICSGRPIGELRTTRMYQNFVMEVEWRHMKPKGNAGIFVWADDITARGVPFHRSVEVQVLENAYGNTQSYTTHGDIFPIHGARMTPVNGRGGSRAFPVESRSLPSPQWNHYRIECDRGAISLAVNGKVVTRGTRCSPSKGYICLESEGGVVHYRKMRIKVLPDTPIDDADVASKNRNFRSIYSGINLLGWKAGEGWAARDWVLAYSGNGPGAIVTDEQFQNVGFVIDVQLGEKSGVAEISVGNTRLRLDPEAGLFASCLQKKGWNRIEGTLRNSTLTLNVNGEAIDGDALQPQPGKGAIKLRAAGPTNFANLFVRELN
ncbi:MAG: family 16 glycoside hydrolase [Planctomycetota bacterium]|nr:family 16 glycoside hydrolase [Planctomycetota bacterium]